MLQPNFIHKYLYDLGIIIPLRHYQNTEGYHPEFWLWSPRIEVQLAPSQVQVEQLGLKT